MRPTQSVIMIGAVIVLLRAMAAAQDLPPPEEGTRAPTAPPTFEDPTPTPPQATPVPATPVVVVPTPPRTSLPVTAPVVAAPTSPPTNAKLLFGKAGELELYQAVQLWAVYTRDAEGGVAARPLAPVNDRGDLFIRRGRLGLRGKIDKQHAFNVVFAYDGLGKGPHSAIRGGTNPDNLLVSVLDATWTWSPSPRFINITAGYFRPQIGRLSITGAFNNNTFEKSMLQTYQRGHIVGRGNGREAGINLGGLHEGGAWSVNYNLGIFAANHPRLVGAFADRFAPLVAGRVALTAGDPEMPKYGISYTTNYFGKRKGVTLAVQGTTQGRTDVHERNSSLGFDLLANYAGLNVMAELHLLATDRLDGELSRTHVWHVSAGHNIRLPGNYLIEPFAMFMRYKGDTNATFYTGDDDQLEMGVNWYVNKNNLKVNLVYGHGDGTTRSEFTNATSFVRGDYVASGLQYVY